MDAISRSNAMAGRGSVHRLAKVIIWLLVLLLFAVTNPSPERHQRAIRDRMAEDHAFASALGVGRLFAQLPNYHSLLLGSYTTFEGDVVSVGVLGMVWTRSLK